MSFTSRRLGPLTSFFSSPWKLGQAIGRAGPVGLLIGYVVMGGASLVPEDGPLALLISSPSRFLLLLPSPFCHSLHSSPSAASVLSRLLLRHGFPRRCVPLDLASSVSPSFRRKCCLACLPLSRSVPPQRWLLTSLTSRDSPDTPLDSLTLPSVSLSVSSLPPSSLPSFRDVFSDALSLASLIAGWNYLFKYLIVTPNNIVAAVVTINC